MRRIPVSKAVAVLLAVGSVAQAREMTPERAVKVLPKASGGELSEATTVLRGTSDLFKKHGKALAGMVSRAPGDAEVARRVLAIVRDKGAEGCSFIASLVAKANSAWVSEVVPNYRAHQGCEPLHAALLGVLDWIPNTGTSEQRGIASKVMAIVREDRDAGVGDRLCRFILAGPVDLRREAVATIVAAKPERSDACLVRAYTDEARGDASPAELRHDLLKGIAAVSGVDSTPTLVVALQEAGDRDLACDLLSASGKPGIDRMVFAVRTGDERPGGPRWCLTRTGTPAIDAVLPLLDHSSDRVRAFAVDFLSLYRSEEALAAVKERFHGGGAVSKASLLAILAGYPVGKVNDVFVSALADADSSMRIQAVATIERGHHGNFSALLLKMAEEDTAPAVRSRALLALWRLGDDTVAPLALRMAQYEVPDVATTALFVLGFMGDEKAADVAVNLLKAKDKAVAAAAGGALWVLGYEDPAKGKARYQGPPAPARIAKGREVKCEGGRAVVLGKKGPLVVALPGGPGIDFTWARPYLDELADGALVAFLEPALEAPAEGAAPSPRIVARATLSSLLKTLDRKKAILIGHGVGGAAALVMAVQDPEEVAGVAVLAAVPPGEMQALDDAIAAALKEPFKGLAEKIVKEQESFHPRALNRYMARVLAPALAGTRAEPRAVLGVVFDAARYGQAFAAVSRAEIDLAAYPGRVLFIAPVPALPDCVKKGLLDMAGPSKGRITVEDLPECGFLPEVTCTSKVLKALERFIEKTTGS